MKILRGKLRGMEVVPHQFGIDWITANNSDGTPLMYRGHPVTLRPDNVELTTDTDRKMFTPDPARNDGLFWDIWEITDAGRFVRRPANGSPPGRRPSTYVISSRESTSDPAIEPDTEPESEPAVQPAGPVVSAADVVAMSQGQPGAFLVRKGDERYWRRIPPPEEQVEPGQTVADGSVVVMTANELILDSEPGDWIGKGWDLRLTEAAAQVWAKRINERWDDGSAATTPVA